MKKSINIGVVGFGNMGSACAEAALNSNYGKVVIYDRKKAKTSKAKGFLKVKNPEELINKVKFLILAIKPQDLGKFLDQNQDLLIKNKPLLVSLLAGVTIKEIEASLPGLKVVRVMPNLAIKAKQGLTFIAGGSLVKKNDLKQVKDIFSLVGEVVEGKEIFMDKITALSGSGPGFIYYFMESFYQTALELGFKKREARKIVMQTFTGAAKLAKETNKDFFQLLAAVASKGGTTEAGISFFKQAKLSSKIKKGIFAALEKAAKMPVDFKGERQ